MTASSSSSVKVEGNNVICRVVVGGELRSRKGLNLPGIDLASVPSQTGLPVYEVALEQGVDIISQSLCSQVRMCRL